MVSSTSGRSAARTNIFRLSAAIHAGSPAAYQRERRARWGFACSQETQASASTLSSQMGQGVVSSVEFAR